jgi:hypothetical protein
MNRLPPGESDHQTDNSTGLRLESARGAIPILVIERAQQPMVDAYSTTADPN